MNYVLTEEEYQNLVSLNCDREKVKTAVDDFIKAMSVNVTPTPDVYGETMRVTFDIRFLKSKMEDLRKAIEAA